MAESVFLKPTDFYIRRLDPINQYIDQAARFLSMTENRPYEECKQFIIAGLKNKKFPNVKDPVVDYFERGDNGDKEKKEIRLSQYINTVVHDNLIIAPSFTVYLHPSMKKSILVKFVDGNVKARSKAKKEAFKARSDKNDDLYIIKENEQKNKKMYNNSLSGTFAAKGSPLCNPTAHSTLTSTTRTVTSFGNATNERVIGGNRHYWSPDIVINNIVSLSTDPGLSEMEAVIEKYSLVYPTVDDVMDCVTYSSDLYWRNSLKVQQIRNIVTSLSPVQRASVVYTGDLYHVRKLNDTFIRNFIGSLSAKVVTTNTENLIDRMYKFDEAVGNLAHHICCDIIKGAGKDYKKMSTVPGILETLVGTSENIIQTIANYKDFINAFFLTINVPCTVAYIPHMVRRVVMLSDTDSTCFALDEWVQWATGDIKFDQPSMAISGAVGYIATQCIAHTLALLSANINVARENLDTLAMKNEFAFKTFCVTSVAKHYYCSVDIREGNVFDHSEMEVKGVHLKNSSSPTSIREDALELMSKILDTVSSGEKISIVEILTHIANQERKIAQSLVAGELEFYRQSKIKDPDAYAKSAEESPYLQHVFWNTVFAPKYGEVVAPPYSVIKVATTLNNRTALKEWIDSIEDKELAQRLADWMTKYKRNNYNTFYLSTAFIRTNGMPKEIKSVIDTKRIISDLTTVYQLICESIGYFKKDGYLLSELGY